MGAGEVRSPGLRLAVDCGAVWTSAALGWSGGRGRLVSFGGLARLPSGVVVGADGSVAVGVAGGQPGAGGDGSDRFVAGPIRHVADGPVSLPVGATVEPAELAAAVLRRVLDEATTAAGQRPAVVCLVVPAGWGPRRRTLMRQCAHRAGVGEVVLVDTPVAVVRRLEATGVPVPVGSWIAVCDIGAGFAASVVARTPDGLEAVSTVDAPAGGDRVDEVFAQRLLDLAAVAAAVPAGQAPSSLDRPALLRRARTAKEALASAASTVVALPAPLPPVVVGVDELAAVAGPVVHAAVAATRQAIEAAMVDPGRCAGVFLVGGGAQSPAVAAGFEQGLADIAPVRVVAQPEVAAVLGAAGAADSSDDLPAAPPVPEPPKVAQAVGLVVPLVTALVVAVHFFATTTVERQRGLTVSVQVLANWGELALACLFGLLGCLSGATLIASALPPEGTGPGAASSVRRGRRVLELVGLPRRGSASVNRANDTDQAAPADADPAAVSAAMRARQVATGLFAAIALGVTMAGLLAVFGSVGAGVSNGSYLRWALLPLLPVTAAAIVGGLLVMWRRVTPRPGWHAFLVFPPSSVICAAVGAVLVQHAMVTPVYPGQGPLVAVIGHGGGALLGLGAALAVAETLRWRVILAGPFAVLLAAVVTYPATGFVAMLYVLAASVWWGRRLWQLVRALLLPPVPPADG
jgi:Hsp70 protein